MFVVQAIFDFSKEILKGKREQTKQEKTQKQVQVEENEEKQQELDKGKRKRSEQHDAQLKKQGGDKDHQQKNEEEDIQYLAFEKGDKILVEHAYESGWWYGNVIKKPDEKGFFPSNYVKVGAKPPPPPPRPPSQNQQQDNEAAVYDPEQGDDWLNKKLQEAEQGQKKAVTSQYYHGIKSYKYVKINQKNQNLLKGNYVKFDVNTGLAKVPVKDQAPAAKAVRQMGYYFDYHQWNEQKNQNPEAWKNKPDPSKKKKKRLHLIGMGKDG